jgi:uncharacterized protein (TIGR02001 family)
MKSIISGSILAAAMAAISLPAMAEGTLDGLPGELSANVAFVNDYRFRGITQSDEDPAIQGGLPGSGIVFKLLPGWLVTAYIGQTTNAVPLKTVM